MVNFVCSHACYEYIQLMSIPLALLYSFNAYRTLHLRTSFSGTTDVAACCNFDGLMVLLSVVLGKSLLATLVYGYFGICLLLYGLEIVLPVSDARLECE